MLPTVNSLLFFNFKTRKTSLTTCKLLWKLFLVLSCFLVPVILCRFFAPLEGTVAQLAVKHAHVYSLMMQWSM